MSQTLEIYLSIFLSVSAVLLIIISVFFIKLIMELSKLTNNLNDITTVIKSDIEPTVKELQTTLKSINSIVKEADKNVSAIKGIATKLEKCGMFTMGDVARKSVYDEDTLYKLFGVNAELLIDHAWGWEPCTIADVKAYKPMSNSTSSGQVLHCALRI